MILLEEVLYLSFERLNFQSMNGSGGGGGGGIRMEFGSILTVTLYMHTSN